MNKTLTRLILTASLLTIFSLNIASAQQSVARRWNELALQAIRMDFARPPVQARNLFHLSVVMYDAWAAYDTVAQTYFLGKPWNGQTASFLGVPKPADVEAARREAISYAAYRLLRQRFRFSPNSANTLALFDAYMSELGYSTTLMSQNYLSGIPAYLGNYIAGSLLNNSVSDGSNEVGNYLPIHYKPVNPPLTPTLPGNPDMLDPNHWQPLNIPSAVDQNGNPIPAMQVFQSPEWGRVVPFALTNADCDTFLRGNVPYYVYHNPGAPPSLDTLPNGDPSEAFKWNNALVSIWSAHLDPADGVMWDISPASIGNTPTNYPQTLAEYQSFYKLEEGGTATMGRPINPRTSQPYTPQVVPRADYTRVLAQFWADGPNSETPPGHWFSIFNKAMDHPMFVRKFNGKGDLLPALEYDVKAYFTLGGALHDAAISAWGIKGWYDNGRPVTALRYMADRGQSSDPSLPRYHPAGLPLIPGYIESIEAGDPLAGNTGGRIGKIKVKAWRGPNAITDPVTEVVGVDWILAENWWPYQRKTFVTPPFAGYISGHSTYSRSAAEALTLVTGDEYFPGGMGEFLITANSGFLGVEKGPSMDVTLQWATYRDASDQTSLSRIWGGIHPPVDDIPGRIIGAKCGTAAYHLAKKLFYQDADGDGYISLEDCDDTNATIYPGAPELCDNLDNDCNGSTDEGIPYFTYYTDTDGDGFGGISGDTLSTCATAPPAGYSANRLDCEDSNPNIHPNATEICDGLDNNCNGLEDDGLPSYTFYFDADGDGFGGNSPDSLSTCDATPPAQYSANRLDCDDSNPNIHPNATEICDGLDNNCNGLEDDGLPLFTYYADTDGDGFGGIEGDTLSTCAAAPPTGFVTNRLDCDDSNPSIHPNATEICDGLDNNCNGLEDDGLPSYTFYFDADGDGFGGNSPDSLSTCDATPPAQYSANRLDCDDSNPNIHPNAAEICDGLDNNCNGLPDDDLPLFTYYADTDGDGFGGIGGDTLSTCAAAPPTGFVVNRLDCDDSDPVSYPGAAEVCDGADNNCDGLEDNGLSFFTYYFDADGDGFGSNLDSLYTCIVFPPMSAFVSNNADCDDSNPAINPTAMEIPDGLDNDCNGLVDDISAVRTPAMPISAYPNPAESELLLRLDFQGFVRFWLHDTGGRLLRTDEIWFENGAASVDLSSSLPGLYLLKLQTAQSEQTWVLRVVKM